jgi:hypothetical protein
MRPELIVFLPPVGNQYLSLGQCGKDFTVEQFIPQFAVE